MKYNNKQQKPTVAKSKGSVVNNQRRETEVTRQIKHVGKGDKVDFSFPYKPKVQVNNTGKNGGKNFIEQNKKVYDFTLGTKQAVIAKPLEVKKEPFNVHGVPDIPKVTKLTLVNKGEIKGYQKLKNQEKQTMNAEIQGNKVSHNLHYNKGKSIISPLREPDPEQINQHRKGALPIILEENSSKYPFPPVVIVKNEAKQKQNDVFPRIAVVNSRQNFNNNVAGLKKQEVKMPILAALKDDNPFGKVARVRKVNVVQSQPINNVMPKAEGGRIFQTGQNAGKKEQKLLNHREYVQEFRSIFDGGKKNNIGKVY
ncbi:hypothetical protein [Candidatus Deianiraea vastatrix]|uniref:Uncharacterized protein n=1 Tax=Candidatus Deianiraea vastatrix TaxID=2163644 RepID=A0A5B8XE12_9RICK|nr:hypothetical protein [Candidatus Deianiraea vastatrix]QED23548.1 hypothetical protein Deia_00758 [Candidatus Deianiraea vastatrix]